MGNTFNLDLHTAVYGRIPQINFTRKPGQLFINDLRKLAPNTELVLHFKDKNTNIDSTIDIQFMKVSFKNCPESITEKSWALDFREAGGRESFMDLFNLGGTKFNGRYITTTWLTLKEKS